MIRDLVAVAHGTRQLQGQIVINSLIKRIQNMRPDIRVHLSFIEIQSPSLTQVLQQVPNCVVVPLLLSRGYHISQDIQDIVARVSPASVVADPLGPDPILAKILTQRLIQAGVQRQDRVILAAAGSSRFVAGQDVEELAELVSCYFGKEIKPAYISSMAPYVGEVVQKYKSLPNTKVAVATYLLAPGIFANQLNYCGANFVTEPIGDDDQLARLILTRFEQAQ